MDSEDEAFRILHENYTEVKDQAYSLVLDQIGKFIEKNRLRNTNFPKRANSAMHILALGVAEKDLLASEEAERYVIGQLERIRDGGYEIVDEILNEIVRESKAREKIMVK